MLAVVSLLSCAQCPYPFNSVDFKLFYVSHSLLEQMQLTNKSAMPMPQEDERKMPSAEQPRSIIVTTARSAPPQAAPSSSFFSNPIPAAAVATTSVTARPSTVLSTLQGTNQAHTAAAVPSPVELAPFQPSPASGITTMLPFEPSISSAVAPASSPFPNPLADGSWADDNADAMQLSSGASAPCDEEDAQMQVMIAEMQARQQMEQMESDGTLWE